jgi:hypothetical protein
MIDGAKLIKKLDAATRKAQIKETKMNAIAGENIISQLRDRAAVWNCHLPSSAALIPACSESWLARTTSRRVCSIERVVASSAPTNQTG